MTTLVRLSDSNCTGTGVAAAASSCLNRVTCPVSTGPGGVTASASRSTAWAAAATTVVVEALPIAELLLQALVQRRPRLGAARPSRAATRVGVQLQQLPVLCGGLGPAFRRGQALGIGLQRGEPAPALVAVELLEGARARPRHPAAAPGRDSARRVPRARARQRAPRGPGPSTARSRSRRGPRRSARWRPGRAPIPHPA